MKLARLTSLALVVNALASVGFAGQNPVVGGKEMFPNKNII